MTVDNLYRKMTYSYDKNKDIEAFIKFILHKRYVIFLFILM